MQELLNAETHLEALKKRRWAMSTARESGSEGGATSCGRPPSPSSRNAHSDGVARCTAPASMTGQPLPSTLHRVHSAVGPIAGMAGAPAWGMTEGQLKVLLEGVPNGAEANSSDSEQIATGQMASRVGSGDAPAAPVAGMPASQVQCMPQPGYMPPHPQHLLAPGGPHPNMLARPPGMHPPALRFAQPPPHQQKVQPPARQPPPGGYPGPPQQLRMPQTLPMQQHLAMAQQMRTPAVQQPGPQRQVAMPLQHMPAMQQMRPQQPLQQQQGPRGPALQQMPPPNFMLGRAHSMPGFPGRQMPQPPLMQRVPMQPPADLRSAPPPLPQPLQQQQQRWGPPPVGVPPAAFRPGTAPPAVALLARVPSAPPALTPPQPPVAAPSPASQTPISLRASASTPGAGASSTVSLPRLEPMPRDQLQELQHIHLSAEDFDAVLANFDTTGLEQAHEELEAALQRACPSGVPQSPFSPQATSAAAAAIAAAEPAAAGTQQ